MLQTQSCLKETPNLAKTFCLDTLRQMVEIPSQSNNIDGVEGVQAIIAKELSHIGFNIKYFRNQDEVSAPLLLGEMHGGGQNTVSIVFHADTVARSDWRHSLDIDTLQAKIYGPGVADNKGGAVMALSGLKKYLRNNSNRLNIQVICSPNEETGSNGFHQLLNRLGAKSQYILGFEPALGEGGVITSRSGNKWYDLSIKGLPAHSGRDEPHVNAAHEFAIKVKKLQKYNKLAKGLRLNIGGIKSNINVHNIICGEVEAKLDLRFVTEKQLNKYSQKLEKVLQKKELTCPQSSIQCQTLFNVVDFCPPMGKSKKNNKLKKIYFSDEENKYTSHYPSHSGGAADINHLSHPGAYCLDGLGPIGGGMHTEKEFIVISDLDVRAEKFINLLTYINNRTKENKSRRKNNGDIN